MTKRQKIFIAKMKLHHPSLSYIRLGMMIEKDGDIATITGVNVKGELIVIYANRIKMGDGFHVISPLSVLSFYDESNKIMTHEKPLLNTNECDKDGGEISIGCSRLEASMDMIVSVGFGCAMVTRDGVPVFQDDQSVDGDDIPSVQHFEDMALKDPDHDWRIHKHGPMHGEVFQRHGVGTWVLVESNQGFA